MTHHTWDNSYLLDLNRPKIKGVTEVDNFDPTPFKSRYSLVEDNKHTPTGFVREDVIVGFDSETFGYVLPSIKLNGGAPL